MNKKALEALIARLDNLEARSRDVEVGMTAIRRELQAELGIKEPVKTSSARQPFEDIATKIVEACEPTAKPPDQVEWEILEELKAAYQRGLTDGKEQNW